MGTVFKSAIKHHMGRRLNGWDYSGRGVYMVTITIEERRPLMGRLVKSGDSAWSVEPSKAGRMVEECLGEIPVQWPGVSVMCSQLMPDHLHFIVSVEKPQPKPLGAIVGSLKAKSTSRWLAANGQPQTARFWASGYVDLVLLRRGQLAKMVAYLKDNPRRLGIKRENPSFFKVVQRLTITLPANGQQLRREAQPAQFCGSPRESQSRESRAQLPNGQPAQFCGSPLAASFSASFSAIGNRFLLNSPVILQVQCSRSIFAYRRERLAGGGWRLLRDAKGAPLIEKTTAEFEAKAAEAIAAARRGATLISPCISHGEREIARRAFEAGLRVITLQNKGFSPLYKPGGRLFDTCAKGNLLMLAPAAWPYIPGEKPPTRETSLVLNRIAQLIAGDGAAEINYRGAVMTGIDEAVAKATHLFSPHAKATDEFIQG